MPAAEGEKAIAKLWGLPCSLPPPRRLIDLSLVPRAQEVSQVHHRTIRDLGTTFFILLGEDSAFICVSFAGTSKQHRIQESRRDRWHLQINVRMLMRVFFVLT
jgi:hypothetical protein